MLLVLEWILILNLFVFNDKDARQAAALNDFHTVLDLHESSVLSQCEKATFDLRNERHREHKSPFQETICEALPLGGTAASLWKRYASPILQASLIDNTQQIQNLQQLLSPHFLQRGLRTEPSYESMKQVIQIIQSKLKNPATAPPLEIAIMGGSVTRGHGCDQTLTSLNNEKHSCAWPFLLQQLLDRFLGQGVVRIHNLAIEGTNSNMSIPLLEYGLFPEGSPLLDHGPDVIINAYASSDNLPSSSTGSPNTTTDLAFFYENALKPAQDFIRSSLSSSRSCQDHDPLILFVDEYLGNDQNNVILGEIFRFEAVDILTSWYSNAGAISPAQAVRRMAFGNNGGEGPFTTIWKQRGVDDNDRKEDVHVVMTGHLHIGWTVAYSLLEMALNFCEEETSRGGDHDLLNTADARNEVSQRHHEEHHDVAAKFVAEEALELVESEIPPALDVSLQVKDMAQSWRSDAMEHNQTQAAYCREDPTTRTSPCSLSFVAVRKSAVALDQYLQEFTTSNDGWSGQSYEQDNRGFVTTKANATVTFRIQDIQTQVKTITLHTVKSYGEAWAGSQAKFTLSWNHVASGRSYSKAWDIVGYLNRETSIVDQFVLDLGPDNFPEKGNTVDLKIELIGGTQFQINALMICSR